MAEINYQKINLIMKKIEELNLEERSFLQTLFRDMRMRKGKQALRRLASR